jgi:hypothetical protein
MNHCSDCGSIDVGFTVDEKIGRTGYLCNRCKKTWVVRTWSNRAGGDPPVPFIPEMEAALAERVFPPITTASFDFGWNTPEADDPVGSFQRPLLSGLEMIGRLLVEVRDELRKLNGGGDA